MDNAILQQPPLPGLELHAPRRPRPLPQIARASGHVAACRQAGRQRDRLLACLRRDGPCTDQQLAERLGLALASVNSARNQLVKAGAVRAVDVVRGPHRAWRTRWAAVRG
jgi:hypothetical protein